MYKHLAITTTVATILSLSFSHADEKAVSIPLEKLLTLDVEKVPERVRVTDAEDPRGRIMLDAHVRILEKLPKDWKHTGNISMSDQFSRAGKKSVKWDFKGGDYIRIKDLGVLSELRYRPERRHHNHKYLPLEISCFIEKDLPKNSEFLNVYAQREDVKGNMHTVRWRFYLTYGGTWVRIGHGGLDSGLGEIVKEMPEGIDTPVKNEVVLQVPKSLQSSTLYLDRIITAAQLPYSGMIDNGSYQRYPAWENNGKIQIHEKAFPFKGASSGLVDPELIPNAPIDPTKLSINGSSFKALFAKKPPIPQSLTKEEQAFVDKHRKKYFGELQKPLSPESQPYTEHIKKIQNALDYYCEKQADGTYRFKESINFSGERVLFKGDTFYTRKFYAHLPKAYRTTKNQAAYILKKCSELFIKAPDNLEAQHLFRAAVAWFKYQVTNPPAHTSFIFQYGPKYSVDPFRSYFKKLIPVLMSKGEAFQQEAKYLSSIYMFAGSAYSAAWHKKLNTGHSLELNHAYSIFESMLYEPDDKVLFAMLKNFRDNWENYLAISVWGRAGMIKPDYTFFHHGEISYWDVSGYPRIGKLFSNTILDLDPTIHKNLSNMVSRYHFGAAPIQGLKGGQTHNWTKVLKLNKTKAAQDKNSSDTVASVTRAPHQYLFDYFYHLDWKQHPTAKKYLRAVMGKAVFKSQEVKDNLLATYPKLKDVTPQNDIHFTLNWYGASSYTRDLLTVSALGGKSITQWRGGTPIRRYGALLISPRYRGYLPLGAAQEGYSWARIPGTTMPELTEKDWRDMQVKGGSGSPATVKLGYTTVPGNGSLSFNETDNAFSRYGNFSIIIKEGDKSKWKNYGVSSFEGRKSYHFFKDKIVALGSDYKADTKRSMSTVLLQEMVDDIPWSYRDTARWNPEKRQIRINGKDYDSAFSTSLNLNKQNYIISPYGNAWIIPENQKGKLKVEWKERETLYKYRFGKDGGINPGQDITKGTGVIASIEQNAQESSSHHYCVVLNANGKSPEAFDSYVQETAKNPEYKVLRQDAKAHAIEFKGENNEAMYSYLVFTPQEKLNLPLIQSSNKRVNIMFKKDKKDIITLSVCDPEIAFDNGHSKGQNAGAQSKLREIKVVFDKKVKLTSAQSGLSHVNPPLGAKITALKETDGEGQEKILGYELSYKTANAVTDTFTLELVRE